MIKKRKEMSEKERFNEDVDNMKEILKLFINKSSNQNIFGLKLEQIEEMDSKNIFKKKKITLIKYIDYLMSNEIKDIYQKDLSYINNNFEHYLEYSSANDFDDLLVNYNFFPHKKEFLEKYMSKHNIKESELELLIDYD